MEKLQDINIRQEIEKMEYEPMDEMEIKLVRWSLGLGVSLLVILYFVSNVFFPGAHG